MRDAKAKKEANLKKISGKAKTESMPAEKVLKNEKSQKQASKLNPEEKIKKTPELAASKGGAQKTDKTEK